MQLGLDIFLQDRYQSFIGKRIGLVTNMTGVNKNLTPTIDLFYQHPDIDLTALYGPEHGIRGEAKEGEVVESYVDHYTGLPVYSLYGTTKKPTKEMLDPVDVIIFDLQDIGARYYTFIYTMAYMMEACRKNRKPMVVLDRPNPINGIKVEGNLVNDDVRSFVGLYPIPNRHGMTVGELALFFNQEFSIQCDLTVVPMIGWEREMYYDDTDLFWVPPSSNVTSIDMSLLYPGTCLVEGTNLSEGRGTTKPFEYIGAPYIHGYQLAKRFNLLQLPGVIARPVFFKPNYQKYKDEVCEGIQLHIVDRQSFQPVQTGIKLLELVAKMYPNDFEFIQNTQGKYFFDLLAGTKLLRSYIINGNSDAFLKEARKQSESFKEKRKAYLLYK